MRTDSLMEIIGAIFIESFQKVKILFSVLVFPVFRLKSCELESGPYFSHALYLGKNTIKIEKKIKLKQYLSKFHPR